MMSAAIRSSYCRTYRSYHRLPLDSALALITPKSEEMPFPEFQDLTELANAQSGVAKVVLESVQDMLLQSCPAAGKG